MGQLCNLVAHHHSCPLNSNLFTLIEQHCRATLAHHRRLAIGDPAHGHAVLLQAFQMIFKFENYRLFPAKEHVLIVP